MIVPTQTPEEKALEDIIAREKGFGRKHGQEYDQRRKMQREQEHIVDEKATFRNGRMTKTKETEQRGMIHPQHHKRYCFMRGGKEIQL